MTCAAIRDNHIRLTVDVYPFFDKYPNLGKSESIKNGMQFNCRCGQTKVKVGYALKRMKEEGLLQEFEAYLAVSSRTVGSQYEEAYLIHQRHH